VRPHRRGVGDDGLQAGGAGVDLTPPAAAGVDPGAGPGPGDRRDDVARLAGLSVWKCTRRCPGITKVRIAFRAATKSAGSTPRPR